MSDNIDNLRSIFEIDQQHTLILVDARERTNNQGERSSVFYKELGPDNKPVAHYRVWKTLSAGSKKRQQNGWEKYTAEGELIDREIHYATLEPDITLQ